MSHIGIPYTMLDRYTHLVQNKLRNFHRVGNKQLKKECIIIIFIVYCIQEVALPGANSVINFGAIFFFFFFFLALEQT